MIHALSWAVAAMSLAVGGAGASGGEPAVVRAVPFDAVRLDDEFWSPRIARLGSVTIPHSLAQCEATGRLANFEAAGASLADRASAVTINAARRSIGYFFNDSDVYKVIEGAAYVLALRADPALEAECDRVIGLIASAQEPDGYLYTSRTILDPSNLPPGGAERWSNMEFGHELYCAGHLYEAAIAYHAATGKRALLDVAIRNADLVASVFGPGRNESPCGHPEIELALVRLAEATGRPEYLELARFFLDARGRGDRHRYGEYSQDHAPILEQSSVVGHAVRAAYLYAGLTDVGMRVGDAGMIGASARLWEDMVGSKVYITGGIGAHASNEGFGSPFDLPIASGYSETCASIASAMWSHRLFQATGEGRYIDLVEQIMYNAFHSGWAISGDRFFYPNPLESNGVERRAWFACACCPPNVCRFVASIGGYVYAVTDPGGSAGVAAVGGLDPGRVYVNLYIGGRAELIVGGERLWIEQRTTYPWEGDVALTVHPERPLDVELRVRIPGWARGEPLPGGLYRSTRDRDEEVLVWVNGEPVRPTIVDGYAVLPGRWKDGDEVRVRLPMSARLVVADERVEACRSRVAVQRGPLVYCIEGVDNGGIDPRSMVVDVRGDDPRVLSSGSTLDGVTSLGLTVRPAARTLEGGAALGEAVTLNAIPYYAWANRGMSPMTVWLATSPDAARLEPAPTVARRAVATASFATDTRLLSDQFDPPNSASHEGGHCHWWPSKGSAQWVQYDFAAPTRVAGVEVYWFDDTGRGECRAPAACRVMALVGVTWTAAGEIGTEVDRFNRLEFEPLVVESLRLEIQSREGWAGGIHEWRVVEDTR